MWSTICLSSELLESQTFFKCCIVSVNCVLIVMVLLSNRLLGKRVTAVGVLHFAMLSHFDIVWWRWNEFIIWSQILTVKHIGYSMYNLLQYRWQSFCLYSVFVCFVWLSAEWLFPYCGDPEFIARPHRNRMGVFGLWSSGLGHEPGADYCEHDG